MIMYMDIETLPADAAPGMDPSSPPGWTGLTAADAPGNYKKPETIQRWIEDNDATEAQRWWRSAALDPMRGRIGCIAYAIDDEPVQVIDCIDDERAGLVAVYGVAQSRNVRHVVAHNGHRFDFAWLRVRSIRHGVPWRRSWWQPKPWDARLVDTCQLAATIWGRRPTEIKGLGLDPLADFLGVERDNPISGAEVLDAYLDGRWRDVLRHVRDDVETLRAIHQRIRV